VERASQKIDDVDRDRIRDGDIHCARRQQDRAAGAHSTLVRYIMKLGNGIPKTSARPMQIHVGSDGEVWFCDADVKEVTDFFAAGCARQSDSPQND